MPIQNENIAIIFEEVADLLEIEEANPFRVRAYRNAARTLRYLSRDAYKLVAAGFDLTTLPGIGKDLSGKIQQIIKTGKLDVLDRLHKDIPASVEELLRLPGLGPKRVHILFHEMGIKDITALESAARKEELRTMPGFGIKTEQRILDAINSKKSSEKRFLRSFAMAHAEPLLKYLKQGKNIKHVVIAGSYRRGRESVGDLDILITISGSSSSSVMQRVVDYEETDKVISIGSTRATVILGCGLQVDIRILAEQNFGAGLHYFTGSKTHNIQLRKLAQRQGLKINEYGVFLGNKRIAGKTEESIFRSVGMPYIPPQLREGSGENEAARNNQLPDLIDLSDIRGDLHSHTIATDGQASLKDMALAAKKQGLQYLAITDHSKHLTIAHGLGTDALLKQIDEIDKLNEELESIKLLKGIEVDILEDGKLDLPDALLAKLDLVVGAIHSHFNLSREKQTKRIIRAMSNDYFSILAHPFGRLLFEREAYDIDLEKILDKANELGCFLELNSQPKRLDLADNYCRLAKNKGVLISINSDAHSQDDLKNMMFGIEQAKRGWLEKGDVLNTRPLKQLEKLLRKK